MGQCGEHGAGAPHQGDGDRRPEQMDHMVFECDQGTGRQLREGDEKSMCSSFERIMKKERAEGKAEGEARGRVKGTAVCVIELLRDIGEPSDSLIKAVMDQGDIEVLTGWFRAAAGAKTIEEFDQAIGLVQQ